MKILYLIAFILFSSTCSAADWEEDRLVIYRLKVVEFKNTERITTTISVDLINDSFSEPVSADIYAFKVVGISFHIRIRI
jgi:hypothetical protein